MLKYEAPVVYDIILRLTKPDTINEPPYLLIKLVCEKSSDQSLQKKKFMRYLEEYRRNGLFCKRPKRMTPEREKYYAEIRNNKMTKYIIANREKIERVSYKAAIGKKRILKHIY